MQFFKSLHRTGACWSLSGSPGCDSSLITGSRRESKQDTHTRTQTDGSMLSVCLCQDRTHGDFKGQHMCAKKPLADSSSSSLLHHLTACMQDRAARYENICNKVFAYHNNDLSCYKYTDSRVSQPFSVLLKYNLLHA